MDNNPLVSICIPVFNGEKYIVDTLQCLCLQTYSNIEIIVVNDGSTDATETTIQDFTKKRVKLISVANGGAAKARNIAFKNASGAYIIFFDGDDYVSPDFVLKQVQTISNKKDIVVLSKWGRFYNNDINTVQPVEIPDKSITFRAWIKLYWYNCNPMTNPGRAIIPRGVIEKAGLWNEELSLNDDLEFFTRVFLNTKEIIFNKEALLYYRSGNSGLSSLTGDDACKSLYNSIYISVNNVLHHYKKDALLLKSCANLWQSFIYIIYPLHKDYLQLAQNEINKLVRPDFKFQASGYTKILTLVFGWEIAKRIKLIINKH